MSTKILPFNIKILSLTDELVKGITPITSLDTFDRSTKNFHDDGLFSTTIFGKVGDEARNRRFSYIQLNAPIIHPLLYTVIVKMKSYYEDIMQGKQFATWDKVTKQFVKTSPGEGNTGYHFFISHFHELHFEDTGSDLRALYTELYEKYNKVSLTNKIVVIPAGIRDFEIDDDGKPSEDEINAIYRKILSKSNLLDKNTIRNRPELLDGVMFTIQQSFNELFDYFKSLLEGKKKLILGKWASRKIFNGTRNVISAPISRISDLNNPNNVTMDSTQIGLYQYMKATMPITMFNIKDKFLNKVFIGNADTTYLVNPKTLKKESIVVPVDVSDKWVTAIGLEKNITGFASRETRDKPIIIEDMYFGLLYKGVNIEGKNVCAFIQDISEANPNWNKEDIKPITYSEMYYMSVANSAKKHKAFVTRYPITGFGSIYPSSIYLRTTIKTNSFLEVDSNNEYTGEQYPRMPIAGDSYFDTIAPSEFNLKGLGADFDGDTASFNVIFSEEAVEEINEYMSSRRFFVNTSGKLSFSAKTDTVGVVLKNLTSNVEI